MRRETYTPQPVEGDYILRCTGISWSVLRSTGHDSAMSISTQDRDRKSALARIRSLTETDHADGWEAAGDGLFRQITRFRPRIASSSAAPAAASESPVQNTTPLPPATAAS